MGLQPLVKSSLTAGDRYPFVLFSAPPSGSQDYAKEVRAQRREGGTQAGCSVGACLLTRSSCHCPRAVHE